MLQYDIRSNIAEWSADLDANVARQVPFATAVALTRTARDVREKHQALMPVIFDRPTRFTLNALQVTPATKQTQVASVWFKQPNRMRQHYLVPQVEGGGRRHKAFEKWLIGAGLMQSSEFAVPASGIKLDANGNMSQGMIVQILSQLKASPDATQWETRASRKRAGTSRYRYFVPKPGSGLARGIWRKTSKNRMQPVLIFVSAVKYEKRYPFGQISTDAAEAAFPKRFDEAMLAAIRTSNSRGRW